MMHSFAALLALAVSAAAQSACPVSVATSVPAPSVAPGFEARVVVTNLTKPRGIMFDYNGHLLVVEQNVGITALTLSDDGGSCLSEKTRTSVVNDTSLNHGIFVSHDGKTLYASSAEAVYSYPYDEQSGQVTGDNVTIVNGMTGSDHTTRTLLLPKKDEGTLIVTRGSTSNIDVEAADITTGHSQIKAYNLTSIGNKPYDFTGDGKLLGWGLRNDVGIDEEPCEGGLYSVENSADDVTRDGTDIHENNPAEKMNFLGYMVPPNGTAQSANQGTNFGYPQCFAAWDPSTIPNFDGEVGTQFAIGTTNSTNNDTNCANDYTPPRLVFQAHMAPLDIKFNSQGSEAWITFHGSWDRTMPSGYKVGAVAFNSQGPVANSTSNTALVDVVTNQNNSVCPDECFRPVAMAWDNQGRLYFSSDSTGEIYVITKAASSPGTAPNNSSSSTSAGIDGATPVAATSSVAGPTQSAPTSGASVCGLAPPMARCVYVYMMLMILTFV